MATPQFQHLFTPFTVGSVTVRNRIVVPGHATLFMPADGLPTDRMLHYWLAKARGGVGLIMTHVHNVMPRHTGAPPVALQTDAIVPAYRKVVDALHDEGVKFFLQLNHVGGEGNSRMFGGVVLAPSAVRSTRANFLPTAQETPHEMEIEDIDEVVEAFRQAASKAREAGFDGVEIQGEVSFMLAQFMSPARNHRQDSYGGSLDNRLRFAREVIAAVRGGIGSDRVVGMRISGDEYFEGGLTLDDTLLIVPRLEATGQLDFIHVGAGPGAASHIPPSYRKAGSFVYLTEAIRKVTDLALICSQRVNDPLIAESVLASGAADLVSMNRAIMTDPEMPTKAREGRLEEIRHCIACNECIARGRIGMPIACTMNAELGREQQMAIEKTDTPRHVLVVGGGPAGLEAARVASLRGHRVTLYEKGDTLGGQPLIASQAPGREELDEVRRYYTYQMGLQEVDVHLNTEATSETIEQEAPDAVVIATGSRAILSGLTADDVPVVDVRTILSGEADIEPGQRVVLQAEDHHMQGLTAADFLVEKGCEVQVLTEAVYAGSQIETGTLETLYQRLLTKGVTLTPLTTIKLIDGRTVVTENTISKAEARIQGVDMIVASYGNEASDELYREVKSDADSTSTTPALYLIGDASAPRRLMDAILDGARVGRIL
ncbi:MAG TPA: FAD-dependent oxidoreductase [Dehalococcoidia bacterium]|nr:FAD-dependent oxidoreductase [Dehalococcoidia bacterium]